jgi:hypothetical protein
MTFDLPIAERKLKHTERFIHQGMWLLFLIAAALMVVLGRSAPARVGSVWMLSCAVLAFMLSFAMRDVVRKLVRRNAEDKIVKDVKTFLEREPVAPVKRPARAEAAGSAKKDAVGDAFLPSKSAGFVSLKGTAAYRTPAGEPVVFDAFPIREHVAVKMNFHAVMLPVMHNC